MANEAFALSPITARPVQPGEEDYHAISEAFMETARGRWFLTEYAKRNRNADTRLVLDAVARLEESLAQKQAVEPPDQGPAVAEAIAAIRDAVEAAQASAAEALDSLALEQKLAPVRKGARVIREIAWRLREIGNDGRICDLIDSQVVAIENGAAQISSEEAKAALDAAFAPIVQRLAQFSEADEAAAPSAEARVTPSPAPENPAEERSLHTGEVEAPVEAPAAMETVAPPEPEAADETITADAEVALAAAEVALAQAEAIELARVTEEAAADAHDEAVLDMIAMEMGAPDPFEVVEDAIATNVQEPTAELQAPAGPEIVPQAPELAAALPEPEPELPPEPTFAAPLEAPVEISLGSTIIASGIVKKPATAANDPLAPIRRMSQAEKIAFFS
ncbi:hypothetical protein I6F35_35285 [Bradyrhizobium sp. BRP22]|uniref:hypothetical protein n=1 Tax=Bradyrhizobium sp. BRP22 TaxID=2793821 RepID=UPI001CD76628|nr:hypothetical protein [Bradyrhizobium sp. BRP22]MCA1458386.1 hypothetical protein [Bradyrhizobium sp. BRP22]